MPSDQQTRVIQRWLWILAATAVLMGLLAAAMASWSCDDAFISVRYARNLAEGRGLVFNPGERVEGYTNLAWTLLIAVGIWLGAPVDPWLSSLGLVCFGGVLLLLAFGSWRRAGMGSMLVPAALLTVVASEDSIIFATSGLETSLLSVLLLGGFLCIEDDSRRTDARGWPAGLLLGLAVATRPDALIFVAAGAFAFILGRRSRALLRYAAAAAAVVSVLVLWRWSYYGDVVPNTYYAKSAERAWWSQGWSYLKMYLQQYAPLTLALLLVPVVALRRSSVGQAWWGVTTSLAIAVLLYTLAVVRAGGDFMFARLFVPLTPLLALLFERTLAVLAPGRIVLQLGVVGTLVATMLLLPRPVSAIDWPAGVADEWEFYGPDTRARYGRQAEHLATAVDGLDVRVAFLGGLARVVDQARVPYALDAETGLTDREMARRPLAVRGRPGHEKRAIVSDLLDRRIHFVIGNDAARVLRIAESLPVVPVKLGELEGVLIHWDPIIVAGLRAQGASIPDFPGELDATLARLPNLSDGQVRSIEERVRRFYLDFVTDPQRESAFKQRGSRAQTEPVR